MGSIQIPRLSPRLSATDAGFLYLERPHALLHIGSVLIVEGRLRAREVATRIEHRLTHMWRYAQRPMSVPLGAAHPEWVDDPDFDVHSHVHPWALPAPGGQAELHECIEHLLAQPLERDRPLWEVHVIEGLDGDRTAVFNKVHHCMVDGMGGVQLLEQLLSASCEDAIPHSLPALPGPASSAGGRLQNALAHMVRRQTRSAGSFVSALRRPSRVRASVGQLLNAAYSAVQLATADIPEMPWNAPIGRRRSLAFSRMSMHGVRMVRDALGGTINDVVLCALAGGLHRYLTASGMNTRCLELTALVPVSLRNPDSDEKLGNRISAMLVPLAVDLSDERSRLSATRAITERLKSNQSWTGIDHLLQMMDELPAGLVSLVGRSIRGTRLANLVATNVPGPREQRYLCGRKVEEIYPIVPIVDGMGLGLAVFSYNGTLYVGLNADSDLIPDLDKLAMAIEESFARLVNTA